MLVQAHHGVDELGDLQDGGEGRLVAAVDGLGTGFQVGIEALPWSHCVAVPVPPPFGGRVPGEPKDLLVLLTADLQGLEHRHDLADIRADLGVLQLGDLGS